MAAPLVNSLEQEMALLNPAFQQQVDITNTQRAGLGAKYAAQKAGVEGQKVMGFRDIARSANTRGLDFFGTPIEEQNTYLATKYLPGLQQADQQMNDEDIALQKVLAGIDTEKRTRAMDNVTRQQSALQAYLDAERDREFQMQKMREEARLSGGGGGSASNPVQPFIQQFQQFIAQNKNQASRQAQDRYINSLFDQYGISDKASRQVVWNAINAQFKRTSDPTKDRLWKR